MNLASFMAIAVISAGNCHYEADEETRKSDADPQGRNTVVAFTTCR